MSSIARIETSEERARAAKRMRHFTSAERARHRVIEKQRREAFTENLLELAELLPALDNTPERLRSKHVIVQESIKQHQAQRAALMKAQERLKIAEAERDALREQVEQQQQLQTFAQADNTQVVQQPSLLPSRSSGLVASAPFEDIPYVSRHASHATHASLQQVDFQTWNQSFADTHSAALSTSFAGYNLFDNSVIWDACLQHIMQDCLPYTSPPVP